MRPMIAAAVLPCAFLPIKKSNVHILQIALDIVCYCPMTLLTTERRCCW